LIEFTDAIEPPIELERDLALPRLTPHRVEEGPQFGQARHELIGLDIAIDDHGVLPHELAFGVRSNPLDARHRGRAAADRPEQTKGLQDPSALVSDLLSITILVRDI
jgi:hypothetical protein